MVNNYQVKENKSNGQKYITLNKEDPFKSGDSVDIQLKHGGVYNKLTLQKYVEENKDRFKSLVSDIQQLNKEHYNGEEWKFFSEEMPKLLDLGERIQDEDIGFKNSHLWYEPFGDILAVNIGDTEDIYSFDELKNYIEMTKDKNRGIHNLETRKQEFLNLAKAKLMQSIEESLYDSYSRKFNAILEKYNFKIDSGDALNGETYSDGKVKLSLIEGKFSSFMITDQHNKNDIFLDGHITILD